MPRNRLKPILQCRPVILPALLLALAGCGQQKPAPKLTSLPPATSPASLVKAAAPADISGADVPPLHPVRYYLFIPASGGKFDERVEENRQLPWTRGGYEGSVPAATEAVKRLLKAAPDKFPPGTKLTRDVFLGGDHESILSFNRAFAEPKWWKNPTRARAAIDAIVNTAIGTKEKHYDSSDPKSVIFYVENKPIDRLGHIKLDRPIRWNYHLIFKKEVPR